MNYFKVNYDRLQNLPQIKYYKLIFMIIIVFVLLIVLASIFNVSKKISFYGIYNENMLQIKINTKLSDILKHNHYIKFNNQETTYKVLEYGEYEIIDNEIYQEVTLAIEDDFVDNEVGLIELYYDRDKIIKYIFDLFK